MLPGISVVPRGEWRATLVFLHGANERAEAYADLALPDGLRLRVPQAPTRRWVGETVAPCWFSADAQNRPHRAEAAASAAALAAVLAAETAAAEGRPVHLAGYSQGGAIGWALVLAGARVSSFTCLAGMVLPWDK